MSTMNYQEQKQNRGRHRQQEAVSNKPARRQVGLAKTTQFIWLITGILEGLIGLRVILKLIAANPENPFASFIYGLTELFLWPFLSLTATPSAGGMVLEIPSLIAMVVFALAAWVVVSLLELIFKRPEAPPK